MKDMKATITIEETALRLGVSRASAYAAAREGTIPTLKIGRRLVVPKAALERMLSGEHSGEGRG